MKTLQQFAAALRHRVTQLKLTQESLSAHAGISRQTLVKALSGRSDFKITTLVTLADRLGLEVVLVPKETAPGVLWPSEPQPRIQSVVDAAIQTYEMAPDVRPTKSHAKP